MAQTHRYVDPEALSTAAAEHVARLLTQAVDDFGQASIALAGGNTPRRMYELLAERHRDDVPWQAVHFFWSDERCVPPEHPDSNYRVTQAALLSHVPAWQEKVHRPRGEAEPEAEARRYSERIQELFSDDLGDGAIVFDVMLLGMGADGHTASLFPGTGAVERTEPCIAVNATQGKPPGWRLSLTLPVINAARNVIVCVAGADKAEALAAVLNGGADPQRYPAAGIAPAGELHWLADAAALGDAAS